MYKNELFYDIGSVFQLTIIWKWLPAGILDHISVEPVHLYRPSISHFYTDGPSAMVLLALIQQSVVFISGNHFENQEDAVNVTADAFSIA